MSLETPREEEEAAEASGLSAGEVNKNCDTCFKRSLSALL